MYANYLVGNPLKNEVIETTFKGPKIKFYFNNFKKNEAKKNCLIMTTFNGIRKTKTIKM